MIKRQSIHIKLRISILWGTEWKSTEKWSVLHGINTMGLFQSLCDLLIILYYCLGKQYCWLHTTILGREVYCDMCMPTQGRKSQPETQQPMLSGTLWDGLQVGPEWNSTSPNSSFSFLIRASGTTSLLFKEIEVVTAVFSPSMCATPYMNFATHCVTLNDPLFWPSCGCPVKILSPKDILWHKSNCTG